MLALNNALNINLTQMRGETNEVPQIVKYRICQLAQTLPASKQQKDKIVQRYSAFKGYQFLNPKSKLHKHFNHRYNVAIGQRANKFSMENQIKIGMEGNLEQLSVGAMCQILKQNLRKGANPYEPQVSEQSRQQFIFQRDQQLFQKVSSLLHNVNLTKLEQKAQNAQGLPTKTGGGVQKPVDRNAEFRKQMTVKQDGSIGVWGGKKFEGLGVQNQFTTFRREQSMNYYQNTFNLTSDKKK